MHSILLLIIVLISFFAGAFALLGYMIFRIMKNMNMDDSNINNAERILSHVVLHPQDFTKMYYINEHARIILNRNEFHFTDRDRPFWYADKDEFSEVVKTRPPQ